MAACNILQCVLKSGRGPTVLPHRQHFQAGSGTEGFQEGSRFCSDVFSQESGGRRTEGGAAFGQRGCQC